MVTSVIFSTPATSTMSCIPDAMAMSPCLNATPLLAHAPSTRVAGRGASPSQSAIRCPRCPCPSNSSLAKFPT